MLKLRKFGTRSAALVIGTAIATITLSSSFAQPARQSDIAHATGLMAAAIGQAPTTAVLNPSHPDVYTVRRGDTLWDIAAMFLRDPWYWPEIWQINPQVANPHLIYPGDILSLAFLDDGRPVVVRTGGPGNTVRLSPRIRVEPIEEAIPTIPYETLRAFLSRPSIIAGPELDTLPYIVAQRDGLMGSSGRDVYARGTNATVPGQYAIVHAGEALVDPDDGEVLGYEGIYVGEGITRVVGDPETLRIAEVTREALVGDYLLESENALPANFLPRSPESSIDGRIISVVDGISLIGQYQVVVINRGVRHGIEPGHVLSAYSVGEVIRDEVRGRRGQNGDKVKLPDEYAGTIMVFRSFERMSYALVMEAESELEVLDSIKNPQS